jgi:pimeloyl-ACP methyl ester carboxylesterase
MTAGEILAENGAMAPNGYLQWGWGKHKVMVLSGWFGSSADWEGMRPALDPHAFTYVFFDYRGYGQSIDLAGQFDFEEAAADVLRVADTLQWRRFSLVGHSMGGMAMQRVQLAAPERVERMVAVVGVPACGSRMPEERLALFRQSIDDLRTREAILDASTGKRLPAAWTRHLAQQSWTTSQRQAFGRYLEHWARDDFSAQVQGNPTPVKVIVGEHDPSMTAERMTASWLAWYPQAQLEVLANTGHYPMYEVPLALAATVQTFLNS